MTDAESLTIALVLFGLSTALICLGLALWIPSLLEIIRFFK
jgi:hypothetical protein